MIKMPSIIISIGLWNKPIRFPQFVYFCYKLLVYKLSNTTTCYFRLTKGSRDSNKKEGSKQLASQKWLSSTKQHCNYLQLKHMQPNACINNVLQPLAYLQDLILLWLVCLLIILIDMLENALFVTTCIWLHVFKLTVANAGWSIWQPFLNGNLFPFLLLQSLLPFNFNFYNILFVSF